MTVYKKHMTPDGNSGFCSASVRACPYGGDNKHFYYDSSIKQEVLNPADPMQQRIENLSSEELISKADELYSPTQEFSTEYKLQYKKVEKLTSEYEKQKEAIVTSYPIKHQSAVRQLTGLHEGAGMVASFDLFDPEEDDYTAKSDATDDEKLKFAKSYLDKFKAEGKLRALISASHVQK